MVKPSAEERLSGSQISHECSMESPSTPVPSLCSVFDVCRTGPEAASMNPPEPAKEKEKQGFFRAIKKKKKKSQTVGLRCTSVCACVFMCVCVCECVCVYVYVCLSVPEQESRNTNTKKKRKKKPSSHSSIFSRSFISFSFLCVIVYNCTCSLCVVSVRLV